MKYIFLSLGIWWFYLGFTTHGTLSYVDCLLGGIFVGIFFSKK